MQLRPLLGVIAAAGWLVMILAWPFAAFVERQALLQPSYRTDSYSEALALKGTVCFVTPDQKLTYTLSRRVFQISFLVGAAAGIVFLASDRQRRAARLSIEQMNEIARQGWSREARKTKR